MHQSAGNFAAFKALVFALTVACSQEEAKFHGTPPQSTPVQPTEMDAQTTSQTTDAAPAPNRQTQAVAIPAHVKIEPKPIEPKPLEPKPIAKQSHTNVPEATDHLDQDNDNPQEATDELQQGPGQVVESRMGRLLVDLTTQKIDQTTTDRYLDYELTFVDGDPGSFFAETVLFDMNCNFQIPGPDVIPITLTAEGAVTQTIQLVPVLGSDLFGNVSAGFAHYRKDFTINFTAPTNKVKLRVDLTNVQLLPIVYDAAGVGSLVADGNAHAIPSFLRFGESAPVKVDVMVKQPSSLFFGD